MSEKSDPLRQHLLGAYKVAKRDASEGPTVDLPPVEEIVKTHAHLVWRQARRFARTSGGVLDVDDLVSVGLMGLIQAHSTYDPGGGRPFGTYAEFRIRGAILDELRRFDPMSQPARRKARSFDKAVAELANQLGREPDEDEMAEHLELSLDDLQKLRKDTQSVRFVTPDVLDFDDIREDLSRSKMNRADLRVVLVDALAKLEERDQQVLALYYFHDLNLREIGEVLSVTEARVCQLHKSAVVHLREILRLEGAVD
ncbi:MAG: RNA polymerase sigma factor FliA [Deltaproteobacteria bacterium]|nr:RNA polymerase sigma factor FliA [Deltaproteobacteria bacterium]